MLLPVQSPATPFLCGQSGPPRPRTSRTAHTHKASLNGKARVREQAGRRAGGHAGVGAT